MSTPPRGLRVAVCGKTFQLLRGGPYAEHFGFVEPREAIAREDAKPFACAVPEAAGVQAHDPRETKGRDYRATIESCEPGCC